MKNQFMGLVKIVENKTGECAIFLKGRVIMMYDPVSDCSEIKNELDNVFDALIKILECENVEVSVDIKENDKIVNLNWETMFEIACYKSEDTELYRHDMPGQMLPISKFIEYASSGEIMDHDGYGFYVSERNGDMLVLPMRVECDPFYNEKNLGKNKSKVHPVEFATHVLWVGR